MEFNISNLSEQATNLVITYAPKLLGAIIVYILGNMDAPILQQNDGKKEYR